ncbi:DNA-binding transcriptional LysR family regulator [Cupriavidus metallidurans]|jgi:DNA-binding transcriptional LysR family regulator|uniref:Transcriptional regulator, LysR family n=1 Tax=Cupriavidus metallidurans (strain ATCC 43123 / DSM 2839 / NBRC 102507 / CH34) TaxID=266264 RepID=Q1LCW6_CUPMC|nr:MULTISPECIES: LysR family transcriptional regulator [Cupriavidus]ABF12010.1 transcriptional regulator, LysR family [Cupriavidus metallidurans CH34]AVA34284.1 LysR family transcriptional regulator [Cupriavidus metallidurans]KWW32990.1 Hca operon transcriptional activator HcaR [Cupriavidus metallidurans]MDE4922065.1 LysR family transcriptional regulator [Cupriavidus metallidurans]QGS32718.1 LysR family transcriptional regulator [Cupriavidus metallidurans]
MDLRRIRHFVVLAETLNFRRAAERLHIAQPALTVSIQKLEAELDTTLFLRDARGVALTASGRVALLEAKRILFHAGQFSERVHAAASGLGGTLRVGFVGSTTYQVLPRLVSRFREEYPGIELVLKEATSTSILRSLEEEVLDVGLIRTPLMSRGTATLISLQEDRFVAALPRRNPLAAKQPLTLADLAQERFVMYAQTEASGLHAAAMAACQTAGFLPRITQEATQIQTVLALVESGLGVALVPSIMRRFGSDKLVYSTLANYPNTTSIGIALAFSPHADGPAIRHFREVAIAEFAGDAPAA